MLRPYHAPNILETGRIRRNHRVKLMARKYPDTLDRLASL